MAVPRVGVRSPPKSASFTRMFTEGRKSVLSGRGSWISNTSMYDGLITDGVFRADVRRISEREPPLTPPRRPPPPPPPRPASTSTNGRRGPMRPDGRAGRRPRPPGLDGHLRSWLRLRRELRGLRGRGRRGAVGATRRRRRWRPPRAIAHHREHLPLRVSASRSGCWLRRRRRRAASVDGVAYRQPASRRSHLRRREAAPAAAAPDVGVPTDADSGARQRQAHRGSRLATAVRGLSPP